MKGELSHLRFDFDKIAVIDNFEDRKDRESAQRSV